ncbi:MAG: c-type cytochrome [Leptolyngbyaceae cyanobacterium]
MSDDALEKELPTSRSGLRPVLTFVVMLMVVLGSVLTVRHAQAADPYIQDVLTLPGNGDRGQEIFQMNCAVCHGLGAGGEVGPSLLSVSARKSKVKLIKQVVSGKTPPMPQFQPQPQVMADLLQYLEGL